MKKTEEAMGLFAKYGNCCAAVLAAYGPEFGMDQELAVRAARGMPGIGLQGNVCGVVTGASMVIGLATTDDANMEDTDAAFRTILLVQQFVSTFKDRHHSTECKDLLGHDIGTQEKFGEAAQANAFAVCPGYVESAVEILNTMLGKHGSAVTS